MFRALKKGYIGWVSKYYHVKKDTNVKFFPRIRYVTLPKRLEICKIKKNIRYVTCLSNSLFVDN